MNTQKPALKALINGIERGEPAALGRAISLAEAGGPASRALISALTVNRSDTLVAGFTGPPGAGKSTLIDCCVRSWRDAGNTVAVIAVDPSSPLSGGALLGDRARMGRHSSDPGVFIRSLSTRGHLGGLSAAVDDILHLMCASTFDVVLIETVGAGQSETEVAQVVDVCVVMSAPGLGDDLQAIKAGILEVADILVVNKGDLPGVGATRGHLEAMLRLRSGERANIPVITTIASNGEGVPELVDQIIGANAALGDEERRRRAMQRLRKRIAQSAADHVTRLFDELPDEVFGESGQDIAQLADRLLRQLLQEQP